MPDQWIRVLADDRQWEELSGRPLPDAIGLVRIQREDLAVTDLTLLADLILEEIDPEELFRDGYAPAHLIFINAVIPTLERYPQGSSVIRMNGWPGFIAAPVWELCAGEMARHDAGRVMEILGWSYVWVADLPGLVTPRVIAMIISEARLALKEGVGTSAAIDTAMKLGTNYPFGPFEWEARLGREKVAALLDAMAEQDDLYAGSRITETTPIP
jgi:3-hydroxybutyryl-CoA dehydrogenase